VWSVQSSYNEEFSWGRSVKWRAEFRDASLPGYELGSRGIELSWQLQNNGKKGTGLWKEDFMCDLKLQWDCYKSVARIRLVKTENPSACVTVNCFAISDSAILSVVPSTVYKVLINPIIQSKTRLINHAQTPARDNNFAAESASLNIILTNRERIQTCYLLLTYLAN
jgi:hypothetical protein